MEGSWVISDGSGQKLVGLELRNDDGRLDGAWRSMQAGYGMNASGFVSDIELTGRDMEVNYFAGNQRSPTIAPPAQGRRRPVARQPDGYRRQQDPGHVQPRQRQ
ncbi:MAG: hypothetical protein WDN06_01385 [Asticcacaulis sp.]